jgi:O-antigen ligase
MMIRGADTPAEGAAPVALGAVQPLPAFDSRWAAHARRLGARNADASRARAVEKVRWTIVFVAFLGYIFAITTYRLPIGNLAMLAGLGGLAFQRDRFRFPQLLIWFGAFLLWCAIGYVRTPYPAPVWDKLIDLLKLWAVILVAVNALRSRAHIRFFSVFFLGCFALFPLRGAFFNYFFYRSTLFGRAIWNYVYSNPNDLAALAILQLAMVAALLSLERPGWVKRAAQVGVVLLPLLVLMTQSRGGFIALALFSICCIVGQWSQLRQVLDPARRLRLVLTLLAVIVVVAFFAPNGVWARVAGLQHLTTTEQLDQVDQEGSARQRFEIWRVANKIIRENPLTGIGVGAYPQAHALYARGEEFDPTAAGTRDTHSTYLNVLAETGVPGAMAFLGVLLSVAFSAERTRRQCKRRAPRLALPLFFLEIGLVAFLAAAVFDSFVSSSFLYIHLALLWATAELTRHALSPEVGGMPPRRRHRSHRGRGHGRKTGSPNADHDGSLSADDIATAALDT